MSESFEQYFAQTPKKPKSPEQIKEERALKWAEEIKKIKERMKKEGETPEGYQRMTELLKKITKIFESSSEETFERGEIINLLLEMEKIHKIEIKNAYYIHTQPDGTLAGVVELSDGRRVPFQGDKLLENIGGKEIKDADGIHTQPDGTLDGWVKLPDNRWVRFFWDGERVYVR